jgi:hypothetical protein
LLLSAVERDVPITIQRFTPTPRVRTARGRTFDSAIQEIAPTIADLQSGECPAIHELAEQLNAVGLLAPSGKPFSYTTMRRVLIRLAQLGLCLRPMTLPESKVRMQRKIKLRIAAVLAKYEKKEI